VIVNLIPEAGRVLGPQPPLQPLSLEEEQNRFNLTLQNFLESFLNPERPLVLFFDDIHWADGASASFLRRFAASPNLHHIMIIASARSDAIDSEHPLHGLLQKFIEEGNTVTRLDLKPLLVDEVNRLLAQSLHCRWTNRWRLPGSSTQKQAAIRFSSTNSCGAVTTTI
jgi:predicted ATPase